jgi:hypothetical protein
MTWADDNRPDIDAIEHGLAAGGRITSDDLATVLAYVHKLERKAINLENIAMITRSNSIPLSRVEQHLHEVFEVAKREQSWPGYGATIAIAHRLSKSVPVEQRSAFLRCTIGNGLEDVRNG